MQVNIQKEDDRIYFLFSKDYYNFINGRLLNSNMVAEDKQLNVQQVKRLLIKLIEKVSEYQNNLSLLDNFNIDGALEKLNEIFEVLSLKKGTILNDFSQIDIKEIADDIFDKCVKKSSAIYIEDFVTKLNEFKTLTDNFFKQNDIINNRDEIINNMRYVYDENEFILKKEEFNNLLKEPIDLDKLLSFIDGLNADILNDYEKENVLDYNFGDNFTFAGYSFTSEEADINNDYISLVMFTNQAINSCKSAYGFVFPFDNLINKSEVDSTLLPVLKPKKRLIEEGSNEILLKAASPIAIFAFTAGGKEFDDKFALAKSLQEKYPQLSIVDIDLTLYKSKKDTIGLIKALIANIEKEYNINFNISQDEYSLFFDEFLRFKQNNEYNKNDVLDFYSNFARKLEDMRLDEVFSGKFTAEEVKFIILNNRHFKVKDILKGNINATILTEILNYFDKYCDNEFIIKEMPQFKVFLDNLKRTSIDEELVITLLGVKDYSFDCFNETMEELYLGDDNVFKRYINLINRRNYLTDEYNSIVSKIAKQDHYSKIIMNETYYKRIYQEYSYKMTDLKNILATENDYLEDELWYVHKLDKLQEEKLVLQKSSFLNSLLSKFFYKNLSYGRLRDVFTEIKVLNQKLAIIRRLKGNNSRLKSIIESEASALESEFFGNTGFKLADYSNLFEDAYSSYDAQYKSELEVQMAELLERLDEVNFLIAEMEEKYPDLKNQSIGNVK